MRWAIRSLLLARLALAVAPGRAQGAPPPAQHARIAGQDYVRVTDWAKANSLAAQWLKPNEWLQLTNRSTRILLAVNHRETRINGSEVWLLFPGPR